MDSRRRRHTASITLRNAVIVSSVISSLFNCTILVISAPAGRWILGDALCQMTGLISQALVSGSAWLIALAALERCYQHLYPADHASFFSEINIKILTSGLYLFLLVLHTGPLYGWGEYSSFRGGVYVYVNMTPAINITMKENNALILSNSANVSCLHPDHWKANLSFTPKNITRAMQMFLEQEYAARTRTELTNLLLIILRFDSKDTVLKFVKELNNGEMTRKMAEYMQPLFFTCCKRAFPDTMFVFQLQQEIYRQYLDIHVPFQKLGICSLDFSPVNPSIGSWIPFVVSTSTAIPYGITFLCGVILYRASLKSRRRARIPGAEAFIVGSIIGAAMSVPYFYVNVSNHRESYINYAFNLLATIMFYLNSVVFIIFSACVLCCTQNSATIISSNVPKSTEISVASEVSTTEVMYTRGRLLKMTNISHSV